VTPGKHTASMRCWAKRLTLVRLCRPQPVEFCLSAGLGSLLVVAVAVLRIYLGWAYVGDRLLSAAVGGPPSELLARVL